MAKIEKPDFKQAKKTIKSAESSLQSLNNLITKKEGYEQNIRSNYEKLQIEAGKNCSITLSPEDNCWAMKWDLEKPCRPSLPSAIWQQRAEAIFW